MPPDDDLINSMADLLDCSSPNLPWKTSITSSSNRRILTCLDRGFSEDVLIYEACGGGRIGLNALSYLTLKDNLKIAVNAFHQKLPEEFNAIHCRHSDYKSDLDMLTRQLYELSLDRLPIYFATDNRDLLSHIKTMNFGVPILNFCTTHADANQPIHLSKHASNRPVVEELLAELSVLALAKQFVCPLLINPTDPNIPKSGFSILAENLRQITSKDHLRLYFMAKEPITQQTHSDDINHIESKPVAKDVKGCCPAEVNLCISIPTFRRIAEFSRLLHQISKEIRNLCTELQECVLIRILENPSEFTDDKRDLVKTIDLGYASSSFSTHDHNIGGELNVAHAYNYHADGCYNWVIGDDEQIIEGALFSILQYLNTNKGCGLLLLHDPSSPPCSAILAQNSWDNYQEFAKWVSQVEPFQLIQHSLISLNIVKNGVFNFDVARFEHDNIVKRAGHAGSYSHLISIITGLCTNSGLQVHVLQTAAVSFANRSPHEEVAFTWSDVRWLWRHYLYWLCYFLGIDYELMSAHRSMDIVFGRE